MSTLHRAPRPAQLSDAAREAAITRAHRALISAANHRNRVIAWQRMRLLVLHRSPATVRRMERERGLA